MLKFLLAVISGSIWSAAASADTTIFNCNFTDFRTQTYFTVYDDLSARIGREPGLGNKGQAYFDEATGAWIVVEFIADGTLPSTLTTILKDGVVWHSRHTMDILGNIIPSQMKGNCSRKAIR